MGNYKKKMFKTALLALGLIVNTVSANSSCKMTINTYSDNTCSTSKEVLPLYVDGEATLDFTFGKCLSQTGSAGDAYMKIQLCDESKFVAIARFTDAQCDNWETPAITGYVPGFCTPHDSSTWIMVSDVSLTGNRFGIGYFDAITIFVC